MRQNIGATVEEWIIKELDKIAKAEDRTRSKIIENILKKELSKNRVEKDEDMSERASGQA